MWWSGLRLQDAPMSGMPVEGGGPTGGGSGKPGGGGTGKPGGGGGVPSFILGLAVAVELKEA